MDDIYRDVWEGTLKNRKLTSTEMLRQKQFLVIVNDASTVQGGFMSALQPMAFAGRETGNFTGEESVDEHDGFADFRISARDTAILSLYGNRIM